MRPKPLMPIRVVIDSVLLFALLKIRVPAFFECVRLERRMFHVKHCVNTRERNHHHTPTLLRVSPSVRLYQGIISQTSLSYSTSGTGITPIEKRIDRKSVV